MISSTGFCGSASGCLGLLIIDLKMVSMSCTEIAVVSLFMCSRDVRRVNSASLPQYCARFLTKGMQEIAYRISFRFFFQYLKWIILIFLHFKSKVSTVLGNEKPVRSADVQAAADGAMEIEVVGEENAAEFIPVPKHLSDIHCCLIVLNKG